MDEIKLRREIRRRKILENADKRLERITRCKVEEDDSTFNPEQEFKDYSRFLQENKERREKSTDVLEKTFATPKDKNDGDYLPPLKKTDDISPSEGNDVHTNSVHPQLWKHLGFKLVILAVVVRIVHTFKLGYLFGETIVIPFALFMMTQLGSCHFDENVRGITGPILFFLGMSPNRIKNLLICYNVVTSILLYFGLYFFTFVCAHLIIISFSNF